MSSVAHIILKLFFPLRNQKKESDLANALAQWRKVEATLSSKDAEYTKLLSENRRLHDDYADLQGQHEQVWTSGLDCRVLGQGQAYWRCDGPGPVTCRLSWQAELSLAQRLSEETASLATHLLVLFGSQFLL